MNKVAVYLEGFSEARRQELVERLVRVSRLDAAGVERLLAQERPRIVAEVDRAVAQQLRSYLEPVGAELAIEPMAAERPAAPAMEAEPAPAAPMVGAAGTPPPREGGRDTGGPGVARRLGFFRRLRWGVELFERNVWSMVGLLLLTAVVSALVPLVLLFAGGLGFQPLVAGTMPMDPAQWLGMLFSPVALAGFFVTVLLLAFFTFWVQAAFYRLPAESLASGERAPVFATLGAVFGRTPDFITVAGLLALIPLPLAAGGYWLVRMLGPQPEALLGVNVLVALLGLWIGLSLALAGPVAVLEGRGPVQTLARAWRLARGLRLRLFGNFLLLGLVAAVAMALAMLPPWFAQGLEGLARGLVIGLGVLLVIVVQLGVVFVALFFLESFYFEARVRKEGWAPGWLEPLEPSWPVSDAAEPPAPGRGAMAWLEMVGFSAVAVVAIYFLGPYLPHDGAEGLPGLAGGGQMERMPRAMPRAVPERGAKAPQGEAPVPGGPEVAMRFGSFFNGDAPHIWLETDVSGLGGLPDGVGLGKLLEVEVQEVVGQDGRDLYDRDNDFEKPFFWGVRLSEERGGGYSGTRDVRLVAGTGEGDVAAIHGTAHLHLPVDVTSVVLRAGDAGDSRDVAGLRVGLEEFKDKEVKLVLEGAQVEERFVGVVGLTAGGGEVEPQSTSRSASGGTFHFWGGFGRPVTGVRVYTAGGVETRSAGFEVEAGETTRLDLED